jgi:hypothetical protein
MNSLLRLKEMKRGLHNYILRCKYYIDFVFCKVVLQLRDTLLFLTNLLRYWREM